ncbi:hypothetical protein L1D19_20480 [Vibrio natriegens]|uniref:hypothetical protein n=1 Tax=Vibrio natriegens TaxID=691 RepID=UPI001EFCD8AC|nr:hypothetical protein [Vibrio natriegens]MCG9702448.1 hypothetical protein [Vibrio natriegens]
MNNPMVTLAEPITIDCVVKKHTYDKNRKQIALQLHAADTVRNRQSGTFPGMPMGKPTVCLPDHDISGVNRRKGIYCTLRIFFRVYPSKTGHLG